MFIILSPAKTLDFKSPLPDMAFTQPRMLAESALIMKKLASLSRADIGRIMEISQKLARENFERYAQWAYPYPPGAARPALFAFRGDAYLGFDAASMSESDLHEAQERFRILSGLHGILRPLDLIMPYRLEMGTELAVGRKKDLYTFWGDRIAGHLRADMKDAGTDHLLNLASAEYFRAVSPFLGSTRVLTPVFREYTKGKYRFVSFNAKRARGAMASWIIRERLRDPEGLRAFEWNGYIYNERMSSGDDWYFTRD